MTDFFKVGDQVVYPTHGVGEITGEELQAVAGSELKVLVITFQKEKMILRVPSHRAESSGLRHLNTKGLIDEVFVVLKSRPKVARGMWSRRAQEYEEKIHSGNMILVAEVVRDLYKNVDDPDRSYSERKIYELALGRLTGELSAIEDLTVMEAEERIIEILRGKRKKDAA